MAFAPGDPYSSAMDNIPLKDLFPNVKVRKRAQSKKIESLSDTSALGSAESQEMVRSKLRKSLTDALKTEEGMGLKSHGKEHMNEDVKDERKQKRLKVEAKEDTEQKTINQADKVAVAIESELYSYFAGVNRKYKEKARSLLFNLKDRSNPELRVRVLSGEISPENLCTMNAEQLASKELSQWRQAKAEEFAHMVVLTEGDSDQPRLVKKTHKGEFFTEVKEEKDDALNEVVAAGALQRVALGTKQDADEVGVEGAARMNFVSVNEISTNDGNTEFERAGFSPARGSFSPGIQLAPGRVMKARDEEQSGPLRSELERDAGLPAIMSLDEYIGSKKDLVTKSNVKSEDAGFCAKTELSPKGKALQRNIVGVKPKASETGKIFSPRVKKKEFRKHEKLWEGNFQLLGCVISPVLALYKSGDAVELHSWPSLVEIKGRVRLDALEKFLQELHLSKTRSIMIITCCVDEQSDNETSVITLKEAAGQYERGERVGYAEPVPGFEMYLFPGGGTSLNLLVEHGYLSSDQILREEEGLLVGFVVCRKNIVPGTVQKSSSQYLNANKHALSARLDSPTRPSDIQSPALAKATGLGSLGGSKSEVEGPRGMGLSGHPQVDTNSKIDLTNKTSPSVSQTVQTTPAVGVSPMKAGLIDDDDLPPGFAPKKMGMVTQPGLVRLNTRFDDDDDDDDLPEFDFASSQASLPPNFVRPPSALDGARFSAPLPPLPPPPPPLPQTTFALPFQPPIPQPPVQGHFMPTSQPVIASSDALNACFPVSVMGQTQIHPADHSLQHAAFHALPRPPPGPVPPGQPCSAFHPRTPNIHGEDIFLARSGNIDTPNMSLLKNQPLLPRPFGIPTRPDVFSGRSEFMSPPQLYPQNIMSTQMDKKNNIWEDDDDDMPEWCPPTLAQTGGAGHEHPQGIGLVKAIPQLQHQQRGLRPPIQAEERGILRAPTSMAMALSLPPPPPPPLPPPRFSSAPWTRPGASPGAARGELREKRGHAKGRPPSDHKRGKSETKPSSR